MRLLVLPALLVLVLIVGTGLLLRLFPVVEQWLQRRAQAKRERLAFERSEHLLVLITVDPLLAERVYQELGNWRSEQKILNR